MRIKGGEVNKVLGSLASKGLIEQKGDDYIITNLGGEAIDADIIGNEFTDRKCPLTCPQKPWILLD